jgi:hypothetical protein
VTRVLGKIGHVVSGWFLCKSLDKQETRNGYKGWENSFQPTGIPGRVSAASHNSGTHYVTWYFGAQQLLPGATTQAFGSVWPSLISQVYCYNAEQMQRHHGQGNPQKLI